MSCDGIFDATPRFFQDTKMFDLSGRVAVVTGAGRGMGLGIAQALASQGAAVAINDCYAERAEDAARTVNDAGGKAVALVADVLREDAVAAMQAELESKLGTADILVNNAGIPADGMVPQQFLETDEAEWRRYLELNLVAVMRCCRCLVPGMCERGWGRVVNVVSEAWRTAGQMGIAAYAAGKAGTVGFSRQLSGEVARRGVTVNCISLGLMDNTGMDELVRTIPCGRLGCAEDAAAAATYLASDEANWVTGQVLGVNGGVVVS